MPTTITGSSITFPDGTVDSSASKDPIMRYSTTVVGNSNSNSGSSGQYIDITCDAASPCPIMIMNYDYWTLWGGWSDVYYSTNTGLQSYGDRFKTRGDNRDFIRCYWVNGALGGPHIVKIYLFYYN